MTIPEQSHSSLAGIRIKYLTEIFKSEVLICHLFLTVLNRLRDVQLTTPHSRWETKSVKQEVMDISTVTLQSTQNKPLLDWLTENCPC